MQAQGAYWVTPQDANALRETLFYPNGAINPLSVGKSPQYLAAMAGIKVPEQARILVVDLDIVGRDEPLSRTPLATTIAAGPDPPAGTADRMQ